MWDGAPMGKKRCICPSATQTCAERLVPNTIMFSNVQLRYPQHIPGIFSSMRLTYCQNIFGSKIAENYSIRGQRIRIFFQNNLRLWRNILKIFQGGMNGRGCPRTRPCCVVCVRPYTHKSDMLPSLARTCARTALPNAMRTIQTMVWMV